MGLCSPIKVMGVVGAGQMGSGIAQIAAVMAHDIHVLMTDIDHVSLSRGLHAISSSLSRSVKKGSPLPGNPNSILSSLQFHKCI